METDNKERGIIIIATHPVNIDIINTAMGIMGADLPRFDAILISKHNDVFTYQPVDFKTYSEENVLNFERKSAEIRDFVIEPSSVGHYDFKLQKVLKDKYNKEQQKLRNRYLQRRKR